LVHVIWTYHGPSITPQNADYASEIATTDNKFILNLYRGLALGKPMPEVV